MSAPQPIGKTPRKRILLFPFGTTHTDKFGPIEFDHADAIAVMSNYERRGRQLAIDVEHATQEPAGKPAEWQESHGWVALEVDKQGLHALLDYNANGQEKVGSRKFPYDSPAIHRWRGNHLRAVEMLSLVKDPARNDSTPLLMTNAEGATAPAKDPTPEAKAAQQLHAALGGVVESLNAGQNEVRLKPIIDKLAAALTGPMAELNEVCLQVGVAQPAKPTEASPSEPPAAPPAAGPAQPIVMSNKPDPLAEFGAEVLTALGAKTVDEAKGALAAWQADRKELMSAQQESGSLLLLTAQHQGRITPDEVKAYTGKPLGEIKGFVGNRLAPLVNTTQPGALMSNDSANQAPSEVSALLNRTMGPFGIRVGG